MDIKAKKGGNFYKTIGIPLLAVFSASAVTLLVPALGDGGMYFLFLTAIIFSTLHGDWRSGGFAAVLSIVVNFFLLHYLGKPPSTLGDWLVLFAFGLAAGFTIFICYAQIASEKARLAAESRYRVIFEDAITGIYETTIGGRYVAANRKLAEMFGYDSPGQMIREAENLNQRFYVEPGKRETFARLVAENENLAAFESEIYRRDGATIWISENALAVRDETGALVGFQGTTIEITDRKRAEADLRTAHEELESKVAERTAELGAVNESLRGEIDIRLKIENALRESEEKFRTLVEVSSDCIWEVDVNGVYTYISPQMRNVVGFEAHELIGKTPYSLMTRQEAERVIAYLEPFAAARQIFVFLENANRHKNGEIVITETSGIPIYDSAGNYIGYRGIVRNITERKQTAEALRRSEEKFRNLVEAATDWIWETDARGVYTYASPQIKSLIGYEPEEIVGKRPFDLMPPDEAARVRDVVRQLTAEKRGFALFESIQQHRNGSLITTETSAVPFYDDAGKLLGSRGIARDITERNRAEIALRESELRLRTVVTAAPVILFALDGDGIFTLSEGKGLEFLGLKAGEVVGQSVFELYADVPEIIADIKRALAGESFINTVEIADLCYQSRYTPIINENGGVTGLIGVSIDITSSKRIENELLASQKQLRELSAHLESVREEERKYLARELHDELGQTLTALKIDLVRFGGKTPEPKKNLSAAEIKSKIPAMISIVDAAMNTTRKIVAELRPGVLDELGLAAAMEWQVGEFQKRTGIKSSLEIEFDEAATCMNLKTTVFRILQECLTNIARHSGASLAQIKLRDEGFRIFLEVEDDGRGISRNEAVNQPSFGIVGMRERAYLLNGTVEIARIEPSGTRVSVAIPRPAQGQS